MSYISFADNQWWEDEKLDDEQDRADMGGNSEVQPIPPPNVDVDTYDQRYGSFSTRFGEYQSKPKQENQEPQRDETSPPPRITVFHVLAITLMVAFAVVMTRRYLKKRKMALQYQ